MQLNNTPRKICYVSTAKCSRERATKYYVIHPFPILFFKFRLSSTPWSPKKFFLSYFPSEK